MTVSKGGVEVFKIITSRDNPLVKSIGRLKQKKYRQESGRYIMDGLHLVEEALTSGQRPHYLLVEQERLGQYRALMDRHKDLPWYVVGARLMKQLSTVESPQGIMAVMPIPQYSFQKVLETGTLLLILDRLKDPGNLGTIIRTAWAFAVGAVLMMPGAVDPFNPKVVQGAMGGILHVPIVEGITLEQLQGLKASGYRLYGTAPAAPLSVYEADYRGRLGIVIGSEAQGLSPSVLACCDKNLAIPSRAGVDSLNAAVACGIILSQSWQGRFRT